MAKFSFAITGIAEVDFALKNVAESVQKKAIRQAIREALKPMLRFLKSNTPRDTGQLKRAEKIFNGKIKNGKIWVNLGPNIFSEKKRAAKQGVSLNRKDLIRLTSNILMRWLEYGTHDPKTGKWKIRPMKLLRRAYDAYGRSAAKAAKQLIIKFIKREIFRQLNKKAKASAAENAAMDT